MSLFNSDLCLSCFFFKKKKRASYNISMNKTSGHILFCCYQLNFLNCYILEAVLMLDNVCYSASMIVNFLKLS